MRFCGILAKNFNQEEQSQHERKRYEWDHTTPPPQDEVENDEEEYSGSISEDDIQSTVGALHNLIDLREQLEDERQEIARLKKEKAELQSKLDEQKDLANSEASKPR
ncbi:MAG: hypothetical protein II876_12260, partial [Synergistaceae bacterium]|nr:hypothetical protein [Synergistaceae bacterium]